MATEHTQGKGHEGQSEKTAIYETKHLNSGKKKRKKTTAV